MAKPNAQIKRRQQPVTNSDNNNNHANTHVNPPQRVDKLPQPRSANKPQQRSNPATPKPVNQAPKPDQAAPVRRTGAQESAPKVPVPKLRTSPQPDHHRSETAQGGPAPARERADNVGAVDTAWSKLEYRANPYYATLNDPFNVGGVRIPDSVNYPSATFSIVKRVALTVSDNGVAAIGVGWYAVSTSATRNLGHLIPIADFEGTDDVAGHYILGQKNSQVANNDDIFGISTGLPPLGGDAIKLDQWNNNVLAVPGLFSKVRLVSAGVAVNSTASPLNMQGVWRGAFAPPGYMLSSREAGVPATVSFDEIAVLPDSVEAPLNTGKGITVTYSPMDLTCLSYCNTLYGESATPDREHSRLGTMFVAASGAEVGTQLIATITLNYEGIPVSNALNFISVSPTIDDPLMLASAMNRRDKDSWAKSGTSEAVKLDRVEHPLHVRTDHDDEKVEHHHGLLTVRTMKRKGASGKTLERVEQKQEGFLESIVKSLVPALVGGATKLVTSL